MRQRRPRESGAGGEEGADVVAPPVPARAAAASRRSRPRRASRRSRPRHRAPTPGRSARRARAAARRRSRAAWPAGCAPAAAPRPPGARAAARCRPTAGVVPSASAISAGAKPSTSRSSSTARWRARQVLQRGDERELDALALLVARLGRGRPVREPAARPGTARATPARHGGARQRVVRVAPAGRSRAADPLRAALDRAQADVRGDPVEPGAQRAAALEAGSPRQARSSVSCSASSASGAEPSIR